MPDDVSKSLLPEGNGNAPTLASAEALPGSTNKPEAPLTRLESPVTPDDAKSSVSSLTYMESARPVAASGPPSQVFGDYELLAEIARGGMGVVYRARQVTLNRVVALKMILSGRLADADDVSRFRTEAEAAGRLQHSNIVAIYQVGEVEGQHFFSMEFIEGPSLSQRLVDGPLPSRVAARYVRSIARAVHYAHCQGILHRDLKPSNIMIDPTGEPHVTDFGLAKRLGTDQTRTQTGVILGTPSYMAPEQASGKTHDLGPACDIYGLGAVLYELITGRPPFRSETPLDTVMQVLHNDPVPPTLLNPKVDKDLETICLKCLEKDPARRYPTAEALGDDLDRYLNDESISARSFNILDRLTRTLERSHHGVAFHTWQNMILIMAAVIFVQHIVVYYLITYNFDNWAIQLSRTGQFVILGYLFWRNRGNQVLPTTPAERELWSIWIGYLIAYGLDVVVARLLISQEWIQAGEGVRVNLLTYPYSAIASGLAFFVMGSNYWGWCYALGLGFFAIAVLMTFRLDLSPLLFGTAWGGSLVALAYNLRRVGKRVEAEKNPSGAVNQDTTPTVTVK